MLWWFGSGVSRVQGFRCTFQVAANPSDEDGDSDSTFGGSEGHLWQVRHDSIVSKRLVTPVTTSTTVKSVGACVYRCLRRPINALNLEI